MNVDPPGTMPPRTHAARTAAASAPAATPAAEPTAAGTPTDAAAAALTPPAELPRTGAASVAGATRVLAIDPATSTGWAVLDVSPDGATLVVACGHFRVRANAPFDGDALLDLRARTASLIDAHGPVGRAYVEDFFFAKRACTGANLSVKQRGAVEMELRSRAIEYELVSPSAWFGFVVGRQVRGAPARKAAAREAVLAKYKLAIDGHASMPSDVFDALGIGIYGVARRWPNARFASACGAGVGA